VSAAPLRLAAAVFAVAAAELVDPESAVVALALKLSERRQFRQ
jgi:hypothetical protein